MRHKNILQFNLLWCTQWNVLQTMKCMTGLHAVFSWAGIPGGHFAAREDGPVEQNRVCLPGERWPVVSLVPSTAHVLPDGKSPQSSLTAQTQNIFVIDFHSKSARVNLVYNHDFFVCFFVSSDPAAGGRQHAGDVWRLGWGSRRSGVCPVSSRHLGPLFLNLLCVVTNRVLSTQGLCQCPTGRT